MNFTAFSFINILIFDLQQIFTVVVAEERIVCPQRFRFSVLPKTSFQIFYCWQIFQIYCYWRQLVFLLSDFSALNSHFPCLWQIFSIFPTVACLTLMPALVSPFFLNQSLLWFEVLFQRISVVLQPY